MWSYTFSFLLTVLSDIGDWLYRIRSILDVRKHPVYNILFKNESQKAYVFIHYYQSSYVDELILYYSVVVIWHSSPFSSYPWRFYIIKQKYHTLEIRRVENLYKYIHPNHATLIIQIRKQITDSEAPKLRK